MDSYTRQEIERAARWGDERQMCDALDRIHSTSDLREAREAIREHASPIMAREIGRTMFFGDVEIDDWGHTCPRNT